MTNPIILCSSSLSFFNMNKPNSYRFPALNYNHGLNSAISAQKIALQFIGSQSLLHLSMRRGMQKNFGVYNSIPGVPLPPPGSPSDPWKGWVLGIVISVVLPFLTHKWGSFLKLNNKIEALVETTEYVVDAVEKVAEEVEKVAEDILDHLPAGNLKKVVSAIENIAERTDDSAEFIGDIIDKVQEVEEKIESYVESVIDEETDNKKEVSITDEAKEEVSITYEVKEPSKELSKEPK